MCRRLTVILVVIKYGSPTATGKITFTRGEEPLRGTLWGIMSLPDGMVFASHPFPIYKPRMSLEGPLQRCDNLLTNN